MPKRKNKGSDEYLLRKIKKLEKKIQKRARKVSESSSDVPDTELSVQEDNQLDSPEEVQADDTMNIIQSSPAAELALPNTESISNLPSTTAVPNEAQATLDSSILDLLGETPTKNKKYSSPIQTELAVHWEHIATTGLSKDMKKDLLEKYFLPENCLKIGPPQLNPEIKAALTEVLIKKDNAIEIKQKQQSIAITCISQALTKMFADESKEHDVIKLLLDAARLLCDSQYVDSMTRRSYVGSSIKKELKNQLYTTEIDSFLFGEKFADSLKAAKAINKSGAEMKTVSQSKSTVFSHNQPRRLNGKSPFPPARQMGAGRRSAPTTQQPQKYSAPPAPTQPTPRTRQPPPPPQRSRGRTQVRR